MRESVRIHVSLMLPGEAGAALLAVIAHPVDVLARILFNRALCYKYAVALSSIEARAISPHLIRPLYLPRDAKEMSRMEREFKRGLRILGERMTAATMAGPRLIEALEGAGTLAALGIEELNVLQMAELVANERAAHRGGGGNEANVLSRIWTPSKPVLHLCFALSCLLAGLAPAAERQWPGDPIDSDLWAEMPTLASLCHVPNVRFVVAAAETVLPVVLSRFKIDDGSVVRVVAE